jgi:hypothetical protein
LDVLRDLVIDLESWTTRVVVEELRIGAIEHPVLHQTLALDWLDVVQLDSLPEIQCFLSNGPLWWVPGSAILERLVCSPLLSFVGGVAITDDRDAVRVGRAHGARVHGTLWLSANACRYGKLTLVAAENLVEALRSTGLRLPCTGREFAGYARQHGLL